MYDKNPINVHKFQSENFFHVDAVGFNFGKLSKGDKKKTFDEISIKLRMDRT